jgi:hypothetical protein
VECHDTIAAVDILEGVGVDARFEVGLAIPRNGLACTNGVVNGFGGDGGGQE